MGLFPVLEGEGVGTEESPLQMGDSEKDLGTFC